MRSPAALTLVEILVALAVFAVGAAALAGLQLSALRLTAASNAQSRLLYAAEAELNHRLSSSQPGGSCLALPPAELHGLSCSATEEPCRAQVTGFECGSGPARRITVAVSAGSAAQPLVLSTVTRQGRGGPP